MYRALHLNHIDYKFFFVVTPWISSNLIDFVFNSLNYSAAHYCRILQLVYEIRINKQHFKRPLLYGAFIWPNPAISSITTTLKTSVFKGTLIQI